ncbi:MAG TPA: carboxymuconolactone decarboxylase family protein [Flavobacterium sp.]|jgi:AhpD family alkylhydroperoxidase|uniref:carboxymuconolactone decarboxylase family protein n=1 Tax=Flavobacterium sp. TaxID=239 RepID=UPI002B6CBD03|nr:carboxymuconolactone decarboxylase family protein [Flavobacterium sp.]MCA0349707.1 carboxymuconolactone decarboxylase family protein [Bacteroidota bacterium]HPW98210.1 carboxymuconolactone decarboxylase family protein [Flavobacterium sp.]HQA73626.1 carboxymuconolactone decarboxylase family protein [Flavobacterium sp.]
MVDLVKEFNDYRSKMNDKLLADNNLVIKRIFNLDTNAYAEGALDVKTKELLGLVASAVLRCDDCIKYHLETAYKNGVSKTEMMETMGIATLVGGTIVIPHLRRAYEFWEALEENGQ